MLLIPLLFCIDTKTNATEVVRSRNFIDPIKNFYNKHVVEGAIKALNPTLTVIIQNLAIESKQDQVNRAPEWLKESLKAVFGLEKQNKMDIIQNMWKKFAVAIIGLFKDGIKKELDLLFSRFQLNLETDMLNSVRSTFYWRRLTKRGLKSWYRKQIEKIIQSVLKVLNKAAHTTTIQTKDDYGNRMGDLVRNILNTFLPPDLQIPDLSVHSDMRAKGIVNVIVDKLVEFLKFIQQKIRDATGNAFDQFEAILKVQLETEVRRKVKEKVPFYN